MRCMPADLTEIVWTVPNRSAAATKRRLVRLPSESARVDRVPRRAVQAWWRSHHLVMYLCRQVHVISVSNLEIFQNLN